MMADPVTLCQRKRTKWTSFNRIGCGAGRRRRESVPDDALVSLRTLGMVPSLPAAVYTAIVGEMLPLTATGADYLRSRALDPCLAQALLG